MGLIRGRWGGGGVLKRGMSVDGETGKGLWRGGDG
jgi:hypothetical protein